MSLELEPGDPPQGLQRISSMEGRIRPNIYDKRRGLPTDRKITTILIDKDRENDSSRLKRSKMHDTVTKMHQMSNIAGEVGGGRAC